MAYPLKTGFVFEIVPPWTIHHGKGTTVLSGRVMAVLDPASAPGHFRLHQVDVNDVITAEGIANVALRLDGSGNIVII